MIVCKLDLQLPMESVPITTKVVSSNPTQCEVYSMQRYVITFGSYLRQGGCFADVSKAFDRVWIGGLLLKLERYGIKGDLPMWFKSYLTNRSQK